MKLKRTLDDLADAAIPLVIAVVGVIWFNCLYAIVMALLRTISTR